MKLDFIVVEISLVNFLRSIIREYLNFKSAISKTVTAAARGCNCLRDGQLGKSTNPSE